MRCWRSSSRGVIGLLVAAALVLALNGVALAQQAPILVSAYVPTLPTDPSDPAWSQARPATIPLTSQMTTVPRLAAPSISTVTVRSLNDGERIAFRLDWADPTRDARALLQHEFRDAAAVMVASAQGVPNICMGSPGQVTNLWHWKADWQEDLDKGFQDVVDAYPNFYKDYYPFVTGTPPFRAPADFQSQDARRYMTGLAAGNPLSQPERASPVEELLAVGFGTATHRAQQTVQGRGVWTDGQWSVAFSRALKADAPEAANLFGQGDVPVAFAVWNGSNAEVGARKQLSGLVTARIVKSPAELPPAPAIPPAQPISAPPVTWTQIGAAILGVLALVGASALGWWHGRRDDARARQRNGGV